MILFNVNEEKGADIKLTDERKHMAMLPENAEPLNNTAGSAPGAFLIFEGIKIFSLPGVPKEMKAIFDNEITERIASDSEKEYHERSLVVKGVPESELAAAITPVRKQFPTVYIKTHPKSAISNKALTTEVEIHLTILATQDESKKLKRAEEQLISVIEQIEGLQHQKPVITRLFND
jgi:molybdopterin-biosynthesis enzyme MoeA-like protein